MRQRNQIVLDLFFVVFFVTIETYFFQVGLFYLEKVSWNILNIEMLTRNNRRISNSGVWRITFI